MDKDSQTQKSLVVSELTYRRLFETAKDGILLVDFSTGMVMDVNPFLISLTQYSKEEFLGKHLWEIGIFGDKSDMRENFLTLQNKGYVRFEDLPLLSKKGEKIDVEFVANSYYVEEENKIIQCNVRDIRDRKKAEFELSENYKRLDTLNKFMVGRETRMVELKDTIKILEGRLVDFIGDQIFIISKEHKYLFVNKSFAEELNKNISDFLGKEVSEFYPKETTEVFLKNINDVLTTGQSKRNVIEKVLIGEKSFEISTSLDPIFGSKEEGVLAVIGVSRKIV